jgi:hypothetical protein
VIEIELQIAAVRESVVGVFETCRPALRMSVHREVRKSSANVQNGGFDPKRKSPGRSQRRAIVPPI